MQSKNSEHYNPGVTQHQTLPPEQPGLSHNSIMLYRGGWASIQTGGDEWKERFLTKPTRRTKFSFSKPILQETVSPSGRSQLSHRPRGHHPPGLFRKFGLRSSGLFISRRAQGFTGFIGGARGRQRAFVGWLRLRLRSIAQERSRAFLSQPKSPQRQRHERLALR